MNNKPYRLLGLALAVIGLLTQIAPAVEYPYAPYNDGKMDPQLKGWPLTEAEREYVIKPENLARMREQTGSNVIDNTLLKDAP